MSIIKRRRYSSLHTWGYVAVGAGTLIGGYLAGSGAKSAASTQAGAAENAQQISQNEFNTITGQEQPFMQGGYGALNQLDYLLGIGSPGQYSNQSSTGLFSGGMGNAQANSDANGFPIGGGASDFSGKQMRPGGALPHGSFGVPTTTPFSSSAGGFGSLLQPFNMQNWQQLSPAYNFQREQGMQGVLNADASGAGALSGAAQKDLMSFNQNLANTSFNNAFNMYQTQQGNIYDRLAGVMQLGQSAATNTGQQGTALAGQAAQSATNIGTALGAGQIGAANAYAGMASNIGALGYLYANQKPPGTQNSNAYAGGLTSNAGG